MGYPSLKKKEDKKKKTKKKNIISFVKIRMELLKFSVKFR